MGRFIHFVLAAFGAVASALMAATAGYVLNVIDVPIDVIPLWSWNLAFTVMMLWGIVGFGYCIFAALDELFLKEDDSRRITGKRTCCQPREYKVTRRPS